MPITEAIPNNRYKRVLLKLSGEVLQNKASGLSIDPDVVAKLARQLKTARDRGVVVHVTSAIGERVGRDVQNAHHQRPRTKVQRALPAAPSPWQVGMHYVLSSQSLGRC